MGLLFLAAGAVFALLFIINAVIQTVRRRARLGFVQTWLAFLVVLLPLLALISNRLSDNPLTIERTLALAIAAGLIVLSLLVMLLELRREERLKGSRGLLGIGAGVLIAVSTVSVPIIAEYAQPTPTPLVVVGGSAADATEEARAERASATPSRTPTPTSTPPRRPTAVPTSTATRYQFVTRTPPPTPTLPNPCLALANYNVNLRALPEAEAEVLATIPFNHTVTLFGRSADSVWWYGNYDGEAGWVKGEFLTLSASCDTLPEREVR